MLLLAPFGTSSQILKRPKNCFLEYLPIIEQIPSNCYVILSYLQNEIYVFIYPYFLFLFGCFIYTGFQNLGSFAVKSATVNFIKPYRSKSRDVFFKIPCFPNQSFQTKVTKYLFITDNLFKNISSYLT